MCSPVRIALISPYELVQHGLRGLLSSTPDVQFVATPSDLRDLDDVDIVIKDLASVPLTQSDVNELDVLISSCPRVLLVVPPGERSPLLLAQELRVSGTLPLTATAKDLTAVIRTTTGPLPDAAAAESPDPKTPEDYPAGLSARQFEIVGLVASGLSNQEIAAQLFVTVNTVKTNLRNAYRRIGCHTRTQAVLWYISDDRPSPATRQGHQLTG